MQKRSKAQKPVLKATAAGMKDWRAHQKFMQRNALHQAGSPSEAQATWLKQYRAAPKNINAFKKARRTSKPQLLATRRKPTVHVPCVRSAWVATCADRRQPTSETR